MKLCGDLWQEVHSWGRLHVTGWVDRSHVRDWAAGGDAVLMPSLDDGMANGLLEGMSFGLCPLVSDIFSDVVQHEQNGLTFPAGDDDALFRAVSRLAVDRTLVHQLGAHADETAAKLTPDNEAEAYLRLFTEVLNEWKRTK